MHREQPRSFGSQFAPEWRAPAAASHPQLPLAVLWEQPHPVAHAERTHISLFVTVSYSHLSHARRSPALLSSNPAQRQGRAQTRPKRDLGAPRDEEGSAPLSAPQRIAGKRGGPSRSSCPELNDPPRSAECPARGAAPAKLRDD